MRFSSKYPLVAMCAAAGLVGAIPALAAGPDDNKPMVRPAVTAPTHAATTRKPALKTGRSVATTTVPRAAPRPILRDEGLSAAEAATFGYRGDGPYIASGYDAAVPAFAQAAVLEQAPALVPAVVAQAPALITPAAAPAVIAQAPAVMPTYAAPTTYIPAPTYVDTPAVAAVPTMVQPAPYTVAAQPVAGYDLVQTGRSVAIPGYSCTTPVKVCLLEEESYVGIGCSCHIRGGQARGFVTP